MEPVPRFYNPSRAATGAVIAAFAVEVLSDGGIFPKLADETQLNALGNAVHAYFASLPSTSTHGIDAKKSVAQRCLKGWHVEAALPANELAVMGERLRAWLDNRCPGAVWHTEVPITAPKPGGGQWQGIIDLVLELAGGDIILVDHKSSPVRRDQCKDKAAIFYGQLHAYRQALEENGLKVKESWIHFPFPAVMVKMPEG